MFKRREKSHSHIESAGHRSDVNLYRQNEEKAKEEVDQGDGQEKDVSSGEDGKEKGKNVTNDSVSMTVRDLRLCSDLYSTAKDRLMYLVQHVEEKDVPGVTMLRERVDIFGKVRPMEPKEEIEALRIPARQLGIIKEEPVRRWQAGQELWDRKFKRQALQAEERREHYKKKYETMIERARENGLELHTDSRKPSMRTRVSTMSFASQGEIVADRRWGNYPLIGLSVP